jgi:histidinol-phosphatase
MYEEEIAFANELADAASEVSMSVYRGEFQVRTKPDSTPVTEADERVESLIRERVADRFPYDAVLGEEEGMAGAGPRTWVIDPIDGTKNFAAGIQIWATLIALVVDGEPVVAVVEAPALNERYEATRGGGARLNGEPIHTSRVNSLDRALVCSTGVQAFVGGPHLDAFLDIAGASYRTRGFGDFWGHVLVARGSAEAMVETSLRTWDWTAVSLVVEEAGGRVSQIDGSPLADRGSTLSTNGLVHEELVSRFSGSG